MALIPGTSRAGITISGNSHVERQDVAKFSMLLSIPVLATVGALKLVDAYTIGNTGIIMDLVEIVSYLYCCLGYNFYIFTMAKNSGFTRL